MPKKRNVSARCHEIQTLVDRLEIPNFDKLTVLGSAVNIGLHIRGLDLLDYQTLRMVASAFFNINSAVFESAIIVLEEIEHVSLVREGKKITAVLPQIPYFDKIYSDIDEYIETEKPLNEFEMIAITASDKLAKSPLNVDSLHADLGIDRKAFNSVVDVALRGQFLTKHRCRGRDILVNPTFFGENGAIFSDAVAGGQSDALIEIVDVLRNVPGLPLAMIQQKGTEQAVRLHPHLDLLQHLAFAGAVKPPSIKTGHAGTNHFLFPPRPTGAHLSPSKRPIYEKAMAIVSAIRQGQYLPDRFAIRSPAAVLHKLKSEKMIRATSVYKEQYFGLVCMGIGRLVPVDSEWSRLQIIDTEENVEALEIAYAMVAAKGVPDMKVDSEVRLALQSDQTYVESLVATKALAPKVVIPPQGIQQELDLLFLGVKP